MRKTGKLEIVPGCLSEFLERWRKSMRLGIYAFYDAEGIADEGDLIYLSAVRNELDELIIVVNGKLASRTRVVFECYASQIFCRENHGYDGGAFQEVLLKHLPRTVWEAVDELVLFNNTVYGPLQPLSPIFKGFFASQADFWGMTLFHAPELPDHIQSYFLAFKKSVLQSSAFWNFWKNLRMDFTVSDYLIASYEIRFTETLHRAGFRYGVLQVMKGDQIYDEPLKSYEMGIPVLKKKIFRSSAFRIRPAEYEALLQHLENEHPEVASAVHAYMRHHRYHWKEAPTYRGLCWSNEAVLAAVRPYRRIYFYGCTVRSFYLMSLLSAEERFFVESDACWHGSQQGEYRVLRLSEIFVRRGGTLSWWYSCADIMQTRCGRDWDGSSSMSSISAIPCQWERRHPPDALSARSHFLEGKCAA